MGSHPGDGVTLSNFQLELPETVQTGRYRKLTLIQKYWWQLRPAHRTVSAANHALKELGPQFPAARFLDPANRSVGFGQRLAQCAVALALSDLSAIAALAAASSAAASHSMGSGSLTKASFKTSRT